jgi:hypothetical protein
VREVSTDPSVIIKDGQAGALELSASPDATEVLQRRTA